MFGSVWSHFYPQHIDIDYIHLLSYWWILMNLEQTSLTQDCHWRNPCRAPNYLPLSLASVSILPPLVTCTTTVHPRKPLYQQYFFESYLTLANTQFSTVINSQFQHKTKPFLPKEGVCRLVSVRCQLTVW